jgi:hypothetical protein
MTTATRSVRRLASYLLKLADGLTPGAELRATQRQLAKAADVSLRSLPRALPFLSPAIEALGRGRWRITDRNVLEALAASPPPRRRPSKSKTPPPHSSPPNDLPRVAVFADALEGFERRVTSTLEGLTKHLDTITGELAELRAEVAKLRSEVRRPRLNANFIDDGEPLADGAAQLRAWIEANSLTHNQAAARLSITPSAVSHYVNGHHMPPAATRKRIAKVTGIPPAAWVPPPDSPASPGLPFDDLEGHPSTHRP